MLEKNIALFKVSLAEFCKRSQSENMFVVDIIIKSSVAYDSKTNLRR